MRLNKFIALHTDYSRRGADTLVLEGRVLVNGQLPLAGQDISEKDVLLIDNRPLTIATTETTTIMLNKPRGYVCSRDGQGSETIYDLLPDNLRNLNSVGRLDKDSSGLLLLTNDGELANQLTHPRYEKTKVYDIRLDKTLLPLHQQMISDFGITLEDGPSKLQIEKLEDSGRDLHITMHEGRNRQIRRTFESLGYKVVDLHRIGFGNYSLGNLEKAKYKLV